MTIETWKSSLIIESLNLIVWLIITTSITLHTVHAGKGADIFNRRVGPCGFCCKMPLRVTTSQTFLYLGNREY